MINRWFYIVLLLPLLAACSGSDKAPLTESVDGWALVNVGEANIRSDARHSAELSTQAVAGTPLKLTGRRGEWFEVLTPEDYKGWVNESALTMVDSTALDRWKKSDRVIVTSTYPVQIYNSSKGNSPADIVATVNGGSILSTVNNGAGESSDTCRIEVCFPDGRCGWINRDAVVNFAEWSRQLFNSQRILNTAYALMGTPYLWGGTTSKAMDCSGLVKIAFYSNGYIMPRDASQQALLGEKVEPGNLDELVACDLLFFGNDKGRVVHVAIYDSEGNYVHSSGQVRKNNFNEDAANYLDRPVLFATHIGPVVADGTIMRVENHPWYFDGQ